MNGLNVSLVGASRQLIEHLARPRVRRGGVTGGTEHEAWFREDTEEIDCFATSRDDFLLGGKPAYMSDASTTRFDFSRGK